MAISLRMLELKNEKVAIPVVLFVGLGSLAYSYMGGGYGNYNNEFRNGFNYEQNLGRFNQMQNLIENGTYQDLLNYREENNFQFARWVDSEEDFNLMRENHLAKKEYYEENGSEFQDRFQGGCPMRENGFRGRGMGGNFYN